MKDLIKSQDKEFDDMYFEEMSTEFRATYGDKAKLKTFIAKVRKETAEMVCDRMIGERIMPECECDLTWNDKIDDEKGTKKDILKELL